MVEAKDDWTPEQKVKAWFEYCSAEDYDYHDASVARFLKLEEVTFSPTGEATTVFSFIVPRELANANGSLHGGAVALIFDLTTSLSIVAQSRKGFWDGGHVSRTLNCTFLRPAPEGTKIFVESKVVHLGKRMAQTTGTMKLGSKDGKVAYTCEHGKANAGAASL
ncbi:hypothetical protein T440DRAFT_549922 [Plenodomus tracheiphilus IPT5]|uniref:Thioesterase domain-containing protein n=1 Tax=Plenodomus tracheiphilus IPT5 TaxID=1408161 RepID=A0A6A7BM95_9PLEO|nr:hypothetical protein T440DRAFT_549922 [Plenodomus tracheiphilus IPT5]